MKHLLLLLAVTLTACERMVVPTDPDSEPVTSVTFSVRPAQWQITRSLTADGTDMTDLWLFDYVDGTLAQMLHKTSSDEDIATPALPMAYGQHTVYFIASRGKTPTVGTTTVTWATASDTFHQSVTLNVDGTTAQQSVTLDRATTKMRITIADEVPSTLATVEIQPSVWFRGIDYTTGEATQSIDAPISITIPSSYHGTTGSLSLNVFGISDAGDEWLSDVTITAKDANSSIIGQVTIPDVPVLRNRVTDLSGPLFSSSDGFSITLNDEWLTPTQIEW